VTRLPTLLLPDMPPACRIGVDLVRVEEVAEAIARLGERYLRRVFTEHEIACCSGTGQVAMASLAARFAAKEATVKVLRPTGPQPDWRSIEVVRRECGACDLSLWRTAAAMADEAGLEGFAVSLTHEAGIAGAVVVATERGLEHQRQIIHTEEAACTTTR
jgi:holo-[acyl-carrier protein] synthase